MATDAGQYARLFRYPGLQVRGHLVAILLAFVAFLAPPAVAQSDSDILASELDRRLRDDVRPLIRTHCMRCHSESKAKGGVRFDELVSFAAALDLMDDLKIARELVSTGQMPPAEEAGPSEHERLILTQWLDAVLDYVPPDAEVDPGWFTIHRLNRIEYRNTLADLLTIDRAVIQGLDRLPRDDMGYGFDNIADVLSISPLAIEQYLEIAERAVETAFGPVPVFGDHPVTLKPLKGDNGQPLPRGGVFLYSTGAARGSVNIPVTGDYIIRVAAWQTRAGNEDARVSLRVDGREIEAFDVAARREKPGEYVVRARLEQGEAKISAFFLNDYYRPDQEDRNLGIESITIAGPLSAATSERSEAWQRLVGRESLTDEVAEGALQEFATRAFRRPLAEAQRAGVLEFYRSLRSSGLETEPAIRDVMTGILISPNFLYRALDNAKADDPSIRYVLTSHELASRLSYFLWSSMPDQPLMEAADRRTLVEPEVLAAHVRRMLADPRADAFVENFAGQWLQLRTLDTLTVDTSKFPEYGPALRWAMQEEGRQFLAHVLRNGESVMNFIDSDFVVINDTLASLYGISGIKGNEFRRVEVPDGVERGGVVTMGAVLAVTSNPTRSSPVKRGLFVLDQILGAPPPPPPPDIPPFEQSGSQDRPMSVREQLAVHVANPSCAACHNRLDPIGLALENFSVIGAWREEDAGVPVDASGVLPDGESFRGPSELKQVLLRKSDQFVEALAGKLLTYGLGRGLEPFDRPAVKRIAARAKENGNRLDAMIEAIVLSDTFRTCRGRAVIRGAEAEKDGAHE